MKNLVYYSLLIFLLSACSRNEEKTDKSAQSAEPRAAAPAALSLPFIVEYNTQTQKSELKHNTTNDLSNVSPDEMVKAINSRYPEIQMELVKKDRDRIHVKIKDASYLSESMGSSGAQIYMAESTYALTEIKGIRSVEFVFEEGDHAAPGVYSRADFDSLYTSSKP